MSESSLSANSETNGASSKHLPVISVVIGSYNGERTIDAALKSISKQQTSISFEVIVVNDASTDATLQIAQKYDVRIVTLPVNRGHGVTLNVGLQEAHGEFMALMDDDCVPPLDWIESIKNAWKSVESDVTMIGGLVEPLETNTFNRRYVKFRRPIVHQENSINETSGFWKRLAYVLISPSPKFSRRSIYYAVGANMSVRVSAAKFAGGFTEARGAGEEESIAIPLRKIYGTSTIQLFPDILMHHDFHPSLRDTFRRAQSYGKTHGRDWIRERDIPTILPIPGLHVLGTGLLLFVSPLASVIYLFLSPLALYRKWMNNLRRTKNFESILYPFIQLTEEYSGNIGFLKGSVSEILSKELPPK